MKKVVVCMAVAVAAICANAASFAWGAANVYSGEGKADGVSAYLMFADQLSADAAAAALKDGKVSTVTGAAAQSTKVTTGVVNAKDTNFDRADAVGGQKYDAYYVLITADESSYFISAIKTAAAKDVGTAQFSFGNQESATKGVAWTKVGGVEPGPGGVPEPTSGLLLVLGGAALALRRKQK